MSIGEKSKTKASAVPSAKTTANGLIRHRSYHAEASNLPSIVNEVINSPGQPLETNIRAFMEPRFGHDFSQVRIHTNSRAADSARAVNAKAYTWGNNIVFRDGHYKPGCAEGFQLIAHELAHVVQHGWISCGLPGYIAPKGDFREHVANNAVNHLKFGGIARVAPVQPAMLSLTRDSRLERFLDSLPQIANETTALSSEERVNRIVQHFAGLSLRDPENLSPAADTVARYFPEETLFLFLQRVDSDVSTSFVDAEEEQMMRNLGYMQVQPRGPWKTVTPFPVTEIITGNVYRSSGRLANTAASFFEGLIEGLDGQGSNKLIEDLDRKLKYSSVLNAVAPGVFAAGAIVGIGKEFWQNIRGIWESITGFSGMIEEFRKLFSIIISPQGAALARTIGRQTGQEWRTELIQLANYNVFRFTYELGKLMGPTIVYAVLTALGITSGLVVSAIAVRFSNLFRSIGIIAKSIERIASHLPRRRKSPIAEATDADIDEAVERMFTPSVTGGESRPYIDGHRVPTNRTRRMDLEDIPLKPGENLRMALRRVRRIIGRKISGIPEIRVAWEDARAHVLKTNTLNASNYEKLYDSTRKIFWSEIRKNQAAMNHFINAGFEFPSGGNTAPVLKGVGMDIPITEKRISLDHIYEKSIGDNWKLALDADNLRMDFAMPNTHREIVQMRHPELR